MEFYEQGVLLFANAKTLTSVLTGIDGDLYIAAADAFMKSYQELKGKNIEMSNRSYWAAFHLYRHCVNNLSSKSENWIFANHKFKCFVV